MRNFSYTLIISFYILSSCKSSNLNYITYYNKVNEIDSIYRFKKDTLKVISQYRTLFKKYPPKNQDRIAEYYTYISMADQHDKNFGGKKSLYKLIPLVAPYWQFEKKNVKLIALYKKYGIDEQEMEREVAKWKKSLNKKMVDSFTVAFKRDQDSRKDSNHDNMIVNDKKNAEMLKRMFENEGFPGLQKIGLYNGDFFMPSGPLLLHLANYPEYHDYFKTKLLEYVKSGELPPRDYAAMMDRYNLQVLKTEPPYAIYTGSSTIKDSTIIDRNRKSIGLPRMKHSQAIIKEK
ncbi:hypothetical protein [Chryseobacterium pennipullorum]|uniref:Uncharacterized protein n=1 Tax=Chryseobacterium pennipullorum TaxID=2258963 RepID=A0A3D9AZF2_9FLAO|nr:hypothetical protein [Chryseobacterium pennipullorum]REC46743.1 hypothetical protein DRF67_13025 [Chryseobacterium pennipullorum]